MTSVFYDLKKKEKVTARVTGKKIHLTKTGKRFSFIGLGSLGNKLCKFITEDEYMKAKVKVIK